MTDDSNTEAVESKDDSSSGEDSDLVKDLRKQIKELNRELKAVPSRSEIEAELIASHNRKSAIESELVALNVPKGLVDTVEEKLGDAEANAEAVAEVLTGLGFELGGSNETEAEGTSVDDLAEVTNLSNQVSNAANKQPKDDLGEQINSADTPAELANIMREAGLGQ